MLLTATPYGGTLWFKYKIEFVAKIKVPPKGFLTATACRQSWGRPDTDQIVGCTLVFKLSERATMLQVSLRTARRLYKMF